MQHFLRDGRLLPPVKRMIQRSAAPLRHAVIRRRLEECGLYRPISRQVLLTEAAQADHVLEIGPFDNPQLRGANVSYFDVLDAGSLQARARQVGRNPSTVPEIHHVSAKGDLRSIDRGFDAVLSCHSIEHQPDLIQHLTDVGHLLRGGGRYFVILPDKRFTFDHYLPESTYEDILAAHAERRTIHTAQSVAMHFTLTTHNSSVWHWLGWHGRLGNDEARRASAVEAIRRASAGEYIDVHAWAFTPLGFLRSLNRLRDAGLIPFKQINVHETEVLDLEFFAVLSF